MLKRNGTGSKPRDPLQANYSMKASSKISQSSNETPRMKDRSKYSVGCQSTKNQTTSYTLMNKSKNKSRSPIFRQKDGSAKPKLTIHRSRSDKNRKQAFKLETKQTQSFKIASKESSTKYSRAGSRKEHSANSRIGAPKTSLKSTNKDYFGSKRNECRYKKLQKKGFNNPLNIMNRAIINLNNSRTNSESSQERLSKGREKSTEPLNSTVKVKTIKLTADRSSKETRTKYEETVT